MKLNWTDENNQTNYEAVFDPNEGIIKGEGICIKGLEKWQKLPLILRAVNF